MAGIVCRNKRHCMLGFCEFVPVWIGLSVRPCWQVLMWAFCEAVPGGCRKKQWTYCEAVMAGIVQKQAALHVGVLRVCLCLGAGRINGLSVRLCWRVLIRAFCKVPGGCRKKQWAFCEAVLARVMILKDIWGVQPLPWSWRNKGTLRSADTLM